MEQEGSVAVLNDAQFGLTAILRPFADFDAQAPNALYQGASGEIPVMFTEGGLEMDESATAGLPGYSSLLVKGLQVPFGARLSIWLPTGITQLNGAAQAKYLWFLIWRQRNVFDYRTQRIPFHYPKQGQGQPSTLIAPFGGPRVVIPAAFQANVVNDTSPTNVAHNDIVIETIRGAQITVNGANVPTGFPAVPLTRKASPTGVPGRSSFQQGIFPEALGFQLSGLPFYTVFDVQAQGDELLFGAIKDVQNSPSATWNFGPGGDDQYFALLFGTFGGVNPTPFPDIGVYMNVGNAS